MLEISDKRSYKSLDANIVGRFRLSMRGNR